MKFGINNWDYFATVWKGEHSKTKKRVLKGFPWQILEGLWWFESHFEIKFALIFVLDFYVDELFNQVDL